MAVTNKFWFITTVEAANFGVNGNPSSKILSTG
jgi:hypothetical protein